MTLGVAIGAVAVAAWAYLLLGRGFFWLARDRGDAPPPGPAPAQWPSVVAVIPARNEADVIETAVSKVLAQGYAYPGPLRVIVVDDNSTDGTAEAARAGAKRMGGAAAVLTVISGRPLAAGWTVKVVALNAGATETEMGAD